MSFENTSEIAPLANHSELISELSERVRERLRSRPSVSASYRLQFTAAHFRFPDARAIADYLAKLGVSHVYSSPTLQSRRGSGHGYDVVDPTRLNEELGSEQEFSDYVAELKRHGMGQILDIVPNHMSVSTDMNLWWMDVLTNGPSSPYAHFFDIDWQPVKQELKNRILLPVLGDLYGRTLESGQLPVKLHEGAFYVQCVDLHLPLGPKTWVQILQPGIEQLAESLGEENSDYLELQSIITALQYLPERDETSPERTAERRRETLVIQGRLHRLLEQSEAVREFVDGNLKRINGEPGNPASFEALDQLLESQVYRLVLWKAGSDELNYRRFFDVTELAAVCTEHLDVFEATHRVPFELLLRGDVDGFRIDHVDGLYDPTEYLWRLQWSFARLAAKSEFERLNRDGVEWSEIEPAVLAQLRGDLGGPPPGLLLQLQGEQPGPRNIRRTNRPRKGGGHWPDRCLCWWRRSWGRMSRCHRTGRWKGPPATTS